MRFLIAPNPFKGSLSARQAACAIARGLKRALPGARFDLLPLADGGPGTLEALSAALGGSMRSLQVRSPLGRQVSARWLKWPGGRALIESAQAVGLQHGASPLRADSFGLGQLLLKAEKEGVKEAWIGLGGSSISDGGTGMARALGWRFLDSHGRELEPGGGPLEKLASVLPPSRRLKIRLRALCDVDNPLFGPRGAAYVYAPQKGASRAEVRRLDRGLRALARCFKPGLAARPGSGAAGGLGYGLQAFLGAKLVPGAEALFRLCGFGPKLRRTHWLLTGEGRVDAQSRHGKLPWAAAQAALKCGKQVLVIGGKVESKWKGAEMLELPGGSESRARAARALEDAVYAWARRKALSRVLK